MTSLSPQSQKTPDRDQQVTDAINRYIKAATRDNTRRSYRSAIEHFEETWKGYLPATADQIARYLAEYADQLAVSTLKQRLAALASWHKEQGFPDPTKAPLVKKVMKGIKELHPETPKKAKPLQIEQLSRLDLWLSKRIKDAEEQENFGQKLIYMRNRALVLIGFWRGFRSDELCRMRVENTHAITKQGITIFLPRSKTDRNNIGTTHKTPALNRLCPITAYINWIDAAGLSEGPVFRSINRWGQLSESPLHPNSVIALLKTLLASAGIEDASNFSSHSLRRGFASWANANQWDLKTLMDYVGWKDHKSAMRYIESQVPFDKISYIDPNQEIANEADKVTTLTVKLMIQRYHKGIRTMKKTRETIERFCLKNYQLKILKTDRSQYEIKIEHKSLKHLEKIINELHGEIHQIAHENQCFIDLQFIDQQSGQRWD